MKILLIDPNIEGRAGEPPFNLAMIKAYLNDRSDHRAGIVDVTFYKHRWRELIGEELERGSYDIVGISCLSFNIRQGLVVAEFVKKRFGLPVIFGGIHVMLMPEEVIAEDHVDMVCTGEGEYTLKELMDHGLDPDGIEGVWHKRDREVIRNPQRELIQDLDSLPFPDWSDYDLKKYFRLNGNQLSLVASRGCPYPCTYCSNHAQKKLLKGKWVRWRSIDNFFEEVEQRIREYGDSGMWTFKFHDDIFILNRKFVKEFCRRYVERGYHKKILWTCAVRVDLVDEEIVRTMRDAGCYEMGLGIESVDDRIRNEVYRRNMSREDMDRSLGILRKFGIHLHVPIIIGSPYDTVEIMERNLQFMKDLNPECMLFPVLMPLPCTEIREICLKEGLMEEDDKFEKSHIMMTKPIIRTKYATREEVQAFVNKVRRFLVRRYLLDGFRMKGLRFLWDVLIFVCYYLPFWHLEPENGWRFIINRYHIQKIRKERGVT